VALALAVVQFAIAERVLPQAENTLKAWWRRERAVRRGVDAPVGQQPTAGRSRSTGSAPTARKLRGCAVFRNAAGLIEGRLAAGDAHWDGQVWRLDGVSDPHRRGSAAAGARADAGLGNQPSAGRCVCASTSPGRGCRA
jgi:hypothetical protein